MSTKQISKDDISTEYEREPEKIGLKKLLTVVTIFSIAYIIMPILIIIAVLWINLNYPWIVIGVFFAYLMFKPLIDMLKGDSQ